MLGAARPRFTHSVKKLIGEIIVRGDVTEYLNDCCPERALELERVMLLLLQPRTSVMFAARSDGADESATPATEPTP